MMMMMMMGTCLVAENVVHPAGCSYKCLGAALRREKEGKGTEGTGENTHEINLW